MKKNKILVVDDERAVCNMLEKFLSKKGYAVTTALSGEEAIKKVKKEKPEMVLLDIRMPGMDGIEALKRIRKINQKVGIVMITAVKEDEVGKKCLESGAYDYITKPFDFDYMEKVLIVKLVDLAG